MTLVNLSPYCWLYALLSEDTTAHSLVLYVHHTLSVRVPEIRLVRWSEMYLVLREWVFDLIGKDARGEARHNFADLELDIESMTRLTPSSCALRSTESFMATLSFMNVAGSFMLANKPPTAC